MSFNNDEWTEAGGGETVLIGTDVWAYLGMEGHFAHD